MIVNHFSQREEGGEIIRVGNQNEVKNGREQNLKCT